MGEKEEFASKTLAKYKSILEEIKRVLKREYVTWPKENSTESTKDWSSNPFLRDISKSFIPEFTFDCWSKPCLGEKASEFFNRKNFEKIIEQKCGNDEKSKFHEDLLRKVAEILFEAFEETVIISKLFQFPMVQDLASSFICFDGATVELAVQQILTEGRDFLYSSTYSYRRQNFKQLNDSSGVELIVEADGAMEKSLIYFKRRHTNSYEFVGYRKAFDWETKEYLMECKELEIIPTWFNVPQPNDYLLKVKESENSNDQEVLNKMLGLFDISKVIVLKGKQRRSILETCRNFAWNNKQNFAYIWWIDANNRQSFVGSLRRLAKVIGIKLDDGYLFLDKHEGHPENQKLPRSLLKNIFTAIKTMRCLLIFDKASNFLDLIKEYFHFDYSMFDCGTNDTFSDELSNSSYLQSVKSATEFVPTWFRVRSILIDNENTLSVSSGDTKDINAVAFTVCNLAKSPTDENTLRSICKNLRETLTITIKDPKPTDSYQTFLKALSEMNLERKALDLEVNENEDQKNLTELNENEAQKTPTQINENDDEKKRKQIIFGHEELLAILAYFHLDAFDVEEVSKFWTGDLESLEEAIETLVKFRLVHKIKDGASLRIEEEIQNLTRQYLLDYGLEESLLEKLLAKLGTEQNEMYFNIWTSASKYPKLLRNALERSGYVLKCFGSAKEEEGAKPCEIRTGEEGEEIEGNQVEVKASEEENKSNDVEVKPSEEESKSNKMEMRKHKEGGDNNCEEVGVNRYEKEGAEKQEEENDGGTECEEKVCENEEGENSYESKGVETNEECEMSEAAPLLHLFVWNNAEQPVKDLITQLSESEINARTKSFRETALFDACSRGDLTMLQILARSGADCNIPDRFERTPMYMACQNDHRKIIEFLLDNSGDVKQYSQYGSSPFDAACKNDNLLTAKMIIDCWIERNFEIKNLLYRTPLNNWMRWEILKYLLEKGIGIEVIQDQLFECCKNNDVKCANLLIDAGADLKQLNLYGECLLEEACSAGYLDIVRLLDSKGLELKPSHLVSAIKSDSLEVVDFLVRKGLSVNHRNEDGQTPLFAAVRADDENIAKYLVSKGADPEIWDYFGETAIGEAFSYGNEHLAQYLYKKSNFNK